MPVQMMIADRTLDPPGDFGSEHTDALSTRDMGWLMGWSCDAQEAFDNHLLAFPDRRRSARAAAADGLPGRVLRLAHHERRRAARYRAGEGVPAALQASVPARSAASRCRTGRRSCRSRVRRCSSSAPARWKAPCRSSRRRTSEFARIFGRRYDPWVEEFMTDDAEVVFFLQGGARRHGALRDPPHARARREGRPRAAARRSGPTRPIASRMCSASSRSSASSRPTWGSAA